MTNSGVGTNEVGDNGEGSGSAFDEIVSVYNMNFEPEGTTGDDV